MKILIITVLSFIHNKIIEQLSPTSKIIREQKIKLEEESKILPYLEPFKKDKMII